MRSGVSGLEENGWKLRTRYQMRQVAINGNAYTVAHREITGRVLISRRDGAEAERGDEHQTEWHDGNGTVAPRYCTF